ncbi:MAG: alpha/beta hydrolase [Polyangiaceae bacterium]
MPTFTRGEIAIEYEIHGEGPPLLLLAPGGMRSAMANWVRAPYLPITEYSSQFRVIAMDQRNAGSSRAPVTADDGWHTYTEDQLALLDELGIERCGVLGMCIGCTFALGLIERAPERVSAAVLQQPIGISATNRPIFYELFDGWANDLMRTRSDVLPAVLPAFRERMFGGNDFTYGVSRDAVARCPVPLLVLRGNDVYHPAAISEEITHVAPQADLVQEWKTGEDVAKAVARVRAFLNEH